MAWREGCISHSLIVPKERGIVWPKFNVEGLLRADSAGRAALYASAVQNGYKTRNEVRELEDDPHMDGGDLLTVQSNMQRLDLVGVLPPDVTTEQNNLSNSHKPIALTAQPVTRQ